MIGKMEKYYNLLEQNETGFTLIEHIIALSILTIIISLIVPVSFQRLDQMNDRQFLQLFSNDLLYTQNLAFHYPLDDVRLKLNKNNYAILIGFQNRVIVQRQLPKGWEINNDEIKQISFNKLGTVLKPGTVTIRTENNHYDIILPFGKGRERIVKR